MAKSAALKKIYSANPGFNPIITGIASSFLEATAPKARHIMKTAKTSNMGAMKNKYLQILYIAALLRVKKESISKPAGKTTSANPKGVPS